MSRVGRGSIGGLGRADGGQVYLQTHSRQVHLCELRVEGEHVRVPCAVVDVAAQDDFRPFRVREVRVDDARHHLEVQPFAGFEPLVAVQDHQLRPLLLQRQRTVRVVAVLANRLRKDVQVLAGYLPRVVG